MLGYVLCPGDSTKKMLQLNSVRKSVTIWITFLFMENKKVLQLEYTIHHSKDGCKYKGKGAEPWWRGLGKADGLTETALVWTLCACLRKTSFYFKTTMAEKWEPTWLNGKGLWWEDFPVKMINFSQIIL